MRADGSLVALFVLLLSSQSYAQTPTADPMLCLPVIVHTPADQPDKIGSCVPVGQHEVLTAAHVAEAYIIGFTGPMLYIDPEYVFEVASQPATLTAAAPDDEGTVSLHVLPKLPKWLETGDATDGEAYILGFATVHRIELNAQTQIFTGFRPFRGMSGSGVVQFQSGRWRVIGVVTAKVCDGCERCNFTVDAARWNCHCAESGKYGRVLVH